MINPRLKTICTTILLLEAHTSQPGVLFSVRFFSFTENARLKRQTRNVTNGNGRRGAGPTHARPCNKLVALTTHSDLNLFSD
jgi:hypothetical protein